jgi:hypothetical protein
LVLTPGYELGLTTTGTEASSFSVWVFAVLNIHLTDAAAEGCDFSPMLLTVTTV